MASNGFFSLFASYVWWVAGWFGIWTEILPSDPVEVRKKRLRFMNATSDSASDGPSGSPSAAVASTADGGETDGEEAPAGSPTPPSQPCSDSPNLLSLEAVNKAGAGRGTSVEGDAGVDMGEDVEGEMVDAEEDEVEDEMETGHGEAGRGEAEERKVRMSVTLHDRLSTEPSFVPSFVPSLVPSAGAGSFSTTQAFPSSSSSSSSSPSRKPPQAPPSQTPPSETPPSPAATEKLLHHRHQILLKTLLLLPTPNAPPPPGPDSSKYVYVDASSCSPPPTTPPITKDDLVAKIISIRLSLPPSQLRSIPPSLRLPIPYLSVVHSRASSELSTQNSLTDQDPVLISSLTEILAATISHITSTLTTADRTEQHDFFSTSSYNPTRQVLHLYKSRNFAWDGTPTSPATMVLDSLTAEGAIEEYLTDLLRELLLDLATEQGPLQAANVQVQGEAWWVLQVRERGGGGLVRGH